MTARPQLSVWQNPYNDTWVIGWYEDDGFIPYIYGCATKEEAEAKIPGLVRSMKAAAAERVRAARSRRKLVT
jgi:hypothetical protein